MLKFLYTLEYDNASIGKLSAEDATKGVQVPIHIAVVANRYGVPKLIALVAQDLGTALGIFDPHWKIFHTAVRAHYTTSVRGGILGEVITDHAGRKNLQLLEHSRPGTTLTRLPNVRF